MWCGIGDEPGGIELRWQDVATPAATDEDLPPPFDCAFEQRDLRTSAGSKYRGHQTGRAGTNDYDRRVRGWHYELEYADPGLVEAYSGISASTFHSLSTTASMKTIIEPFRIKSVEPIHLTTTAEHEERLRAATMSGTSPAPFYRAVRTAGLI